AAAGLLFGAVLFFPFAGLPLAVLPVPVGDQVQIAGPLDAGHAGLAGALRVGRALIRRRIVGRHRRAVGVRRVREAGARVGVAVPVFDAPGRVLVLLRQDLRDLLVRRLA